MKTANYKTLGKQNLLADAFLVVVVGPPLLAVALFALIAFAPLIAMYLLFECVTNRQKNRLKFRQQNNSKKELTK